MTVFYCVRHGKTEFNEKGIFQGGTVDSPLVPAGLIGAKKLGKQLQDIAFDQVVVSPLNRAKETCQLLLAENQFPTEMRVLADLREMEFGVWDGQVEDNYRHLAEFQALLHEPHKYQANLCGGETFQEVLDRSYLCFQQLAKEHPDGTVLVVSHGLLLQTFIKTIQGIALSDIRKGTPLKNTSVSILETEDAGQNFVVKKWNCTELSFKKRGGWDRSV